MLDIALLGTGGMTPLPDRHLTAMAARCRGEVLLIDCGEGTQVTFGQVGWGFKSLTCICITHFHADHVAGLPGLLSTVANAGKTQPLTMVGPNGLRRVVENLLTICAPLPFPIEYRELSFADGAPVSLEPMGPFCLCALPLEHGVPCIGYTVSIPRAGRFQPEKARDLQIPQPLWGKLQAGEAVCRQGGKIHPHQVLGPPRKGLKVGYLTDSRPVETIPGFIAGSDLFICEGLYGADEKLPNAVKYNHMIFSEAARLAAAGGVKELWLTHYSPAFQNPQEHLESARSIFQNAHAGYDRKMKHLSFSDATALV
ncbi:MAG: ribonuclease Z [Clostridiales bacterium]|nr:ribonuclease Z [Clostridiales bacterium]